MQDQIIVKGAKEHNLKNINLTIPKNKLVVLTGLSGSGKSSFAFDTLYAEGQRRYVESLSSYARQFLGIMKKPDVESIEGLSPAISIEQKTVSHNPRSTVGTITEIYDYLRLLFARVGHPHCPNCGVEISSQSVDQMYHQFLKLVSQKLSLPENKKKGVRLFLLSPIVRGRKGEFRNLLNSLSQQGYQRARIDGQVFELFTEINLLKNNKHNIEAIIDRITVTKESLANLNSDKGEQLRSRIIEALENALKISDGLAMLSFIEDDSFDFPQNPKKYEDHLFSERFACPQCNLTLPELEPRLFSFNTPHGACPICNGLGELKKIDPKLILNPKLTISEGGILPFNRMLENTNSLFFNILYKVSQKYHFDLKTKISNLTKKALDKVLNGTQDDIYKMSGVKNDGSKYEFTTKFEGIIPNLERRYLETKSEFMRNEIAKFMRKEVCPECLGTRLNPEALTVEIDHKNISDITQMSIGDSFTWIKKLNNKDLTLSTKEKIIASSILKELQTRLGFLVSVGLDYLDLARSAGTLAGGEGQRIRLASQIGSGLSGVLYVLDEPSIGLHQRDNHRLIETLKHLRDLGNTVVVVEHDMDTMKTADYLVDFGPLAGEQGGEVVSKGTPEEIANDPKSLTGKYLSGKKKIHVIPSEIKEDQKTLDLIGCTGHNLKNITVKFPLGKFICVTGLSGSGKSTLVNDTLYHALSQKINYRHREPGEEYRDIKGFESLKRVAMIDQSPIGRTPRSNPATYTKTFDFIRQVFSQTAEAKIRGYKPGRFSFNVRGGRCEACQGEGQIKIEMQFLPDVYVDCEVCQGKRYNYETLQVLYKNKSIDEILQMTVEKALAFFQHHRQIHERLQTLYEVGLGYIRLGQPAPTLSGGEAQRIKLATELAKVTNTNTIYLLDEPTTGLHFADLEKLLLVIKKLSAKGNTIVVIEHNLDVIKNADWIVDLGPDGGNKGGEIVATGTPKQIAQNGKSWTGKFLKKVL